MKFSFNEEQEELRRTARSFLEKHASSERTRAAMTSERGYEEQVWRRIATELGWTAITIPEAHGGLGLGYVELVALLEETGRALLCSPFFATIALGANAILAGADEEQKARLLPAIASGETTATLALTESNGRWDAESIATTASAKGTEYVLGGTKRYVLDGDTADLLVVAARQPETAGEEGVGLFVVPADSPGLERTWLPTMDQTRRLAEVHLKDVRAPASALLACGFSSWPTIERTLDLAALALAAEQLGGAERCLDMTVTYAKERKQFGRPIGSFQAIKHKCADMLLRVESARSAAYYGAWAASVEEPDLSTLASLAKSYCSDTYFHCAAESLQIHGGVGFTWEYDVHLHFKRAKSSELMFGTPAYHRERVARRIGL